MGFLETESLVVQAGLDLFTPLSSLPSARMTDNTTPSFLVCGFDFLQIVEKTKSEAIAAGHIGTLEAELEQGRKNVSAN